MKVFIIIIALLLSSQLLARGAFEIFDSCKKELDEIHQLNKGLMDQSFQIIESVEISARDVSQLHQNRNEMFKNISRLFNLECEDSPHYAEVDGAVRFYYHQMNVMIGMLE